MNHKLLLVGVTLLVSSIISASARPAEETPASVVPLSSTPASSTVSPTEESKVSKFFDDVSSAFKQGTAKVKESFESAATSVKDGVLRGYGYVKDKLTGTGETTTTSSTLSTNPTTPLEPSSAGADSKTVSARSIASSANALTTAKTVDVEPNDEEAKEDDRLIFVEDEETGTDSPVPTTTAKGGNLDDRFIIDGPMACKSGQVAVNGKCRNTF